MPIHDWTRVNAGIFHDFHHEWITAIKHSLNAGALPADYYALAEQVAGGFGPDVLTLEHVAGDRPARDGNGATGDHCGGPAGVAVATMPPKVRFTAMAEKDLYRRHQSKLAIRHSSDDRVVAVIEIVSPGNKSSGNALSSFVDKACRLLEEEIQLLVIDLFPPGPRDPQGIHGAIWSEIEDHSFELPADKPLTLAAYSADTHQHAFIEPVAVGDTLPDMPLFLNADYYVNTPLQESYETAFAGVPQRWQEELQ